jgi:hypothetical protein
MSSIQELRNWIEVERKQAEHNVRESRESRGGNEFYNHYNAGRLATLRKVLDKIDVLVAVEVPVAAKSPYEQADGTMLAVD